MAVGKSALKSSKDRSPIVQAIAFAEKKTTGEIRVHITKHLRDPDPMGRALALFDEYRMTQTTDRNAILIYVNIRLRKFSIIADEGIHRAVGQRYWDELAVNLKEDLLSTYFENAIALTIFTLGMTLEKYFPKEV